MPKLLELKAQPGYKLWLRYADGTEGDVDLSPFAGNGVFVIWNSPGVFEQVRLSEYGAPIWEESLDLCPDALYLQLTGRKPEEVFPALRRASANA